MFALQSREQKLDGSSAVFEIRNLVLEVANTLFGGFAQVAVANTSLGLVVHCNGHRLRCRQYL